MSIIPVRSPKQEQIRSIFATAFVTPLWNSYSFFTNTWCTLYVWLCNLIFSLSWRIPTSDSYRPRFTWFPRVFCRGYCHGISSIGAFLNVTIIYLLSVVLFLIACFVLWHHHMHSGLLLLDSLRTLIILYLCISSSTHHAKTPEGLFGRAFDSVYSLWTCWWRYGFWYDFHCRLVY